METLQHAPEIRWRAGEKLPVGPPFVQRLLRGEFFREDAASFLLSNAQRYGDLVYFKALGRTVVQFNHPELVGEMMVRDSGHHHRNLVMQRSKAVLGEGLLTSEEPLHMRQRRLAAPAFHRQRVSAYGAIISEYAMRMTAGWQDGAVRDVHAEMLLLALRITGKTLFDTDVEQEVHQIAAAVDSFQGFLPLAFVPFSTFVQGLPIPAMRRIRKGREDLDTLIYSMIRERRADPRDRGDLLSMLLAATDSEGGEDAGRSGVLSGMTDTQVRDECLTVLLAGHETTANALSFALWLLAHHEAVQEELAEESRRVLGGRAPVAGDYAQLPLAEQVFAEALRLYPPVWVTARTAAETYTYRGMTIERGAMLIAPQFAIQRDPRFFPDPLALTRGGLPRPARRSVPSTHTFRSGPGAGSASAKGWHGWRGHCRWRRWCRNGSFVRRRASLRRCGSALRSRCGQKGRCRCCWSGAGRDSGATSENSGFFAALRMTQFVDLELRTPFQDDALSRLSEFAAPAQAVHVALVEQRAVAKRECLRTGERAEERRAF